MTNDRSRMVNEKSRFHRLWILVLTLSILPMYGCGRYRARREIAENDYFAQILMRVDRRSMGNDGFFEENLLANPYSEVRQWCAIALGRIASPGALPLLYRAVHTGDAAVRAASAFSIGEIEDRERLEPQFRLPDPLASKELISLLDDPSPTVQMRAIEALGKTGSPREAREIARRLEGFSGSGSLTERAYVGFAITALGRLKDPVAFPVLERLAKTGDPEIQSHASDALGRLQAEKATAPATQRLADKADISDRFDEPGDRPGSVTEAISRALAASRRNSTIAMVETTRGNLEIELFREDAPLTAAAFVLEARGGAYDGFVFDEVLPSQLIGWKAVASSGVDRTLNGEANLRPFERGSVGIETAFGKRHHGRLFVALAPQPYRDGIDTCFGRLISGMPVADRIVPGDRILHIHIKETVGVLDRILQ
jgi:peptidyl-prolyl cis-trans isomerase B (cyclophilin B)